MKISKHLYFLINFLVSFPAQALFDVLHSIDHLPLYVLASNYQPQDILIALDIDDTIIKKSFRPSISGFKALFFPQPHLKGTNFFDRLNFISVARKCEKNSVKIIDFFKEGGYKVVALTARPPLLAQCTLDDFSIVNLELKFDLVESRLLNSDNLKKPCLYHGGIIFAGTNDKGHALEAFTQHIEFNPKLIVFVDNLRKHVHAVERATQKMDTEYIGLHYKPSRKRAKQKMKIVSNTDEKSKQIEEK